MTPRHNERTTEVLQRKPVDRRDVVGDYEVLIDKRAARQRIDGRDLVADKTITQLPPGRQLV
ncbi:MAG: hypothetical protein H0U03_08350 [Actinobacteria bacterium]|nr:hypothetical protein [Actinomycetota bacterium]